MFIIASLENILQHLDKLEAEKQPLWGKMTAQEMVEHITDTLVMAVGNSNFPLAIPEDKIEKMQAFLISDKEMLRNIEVPFAPTERTLRNDELATAIDELVEAWINWEETFESQPGLKTLHPFYGHLNFDQWKRLHQKHLTHHFKQFELVA